MQFIINHKIINTSQHPNTPLLEFIRYNLNLKGTKTGCNEGDCGACTVMVGDLDNGKISYRTQTSCLTPIGNVQGKHVVTIEGISPQKTTAQLQNRPLSPVQQAMCDNYATQCGFCTPGFVMSMTNHCLSDKPCTKDNLMVAIDGNICRCTGYHSIFRACESLALFNEEKANAADALSFAIDKNIVPAYFKNIPALLLQLQVPKVYSTAPIKVGGGTDIYVQKHDTVKTIPLEFSNFEMPPTIEIANGKIKISATTTVSHLREHKAFNSIFPNFIKHSKLVSSTPIRNMASIAGNFINASPIGDFTAFFLALNAGVTFNTNRYILLKDLYLGYKQLDKSPEEYIVSIDCDIPSPNSFFNFEKVSKRQHLDIASANSACLMEVESNVIKAIRISAGGVGPTPMLLSKTASFLEGRPINNETLQHAMDIIDTEISPMSDARGTEQYKRLLIKQLVKAHFIEFAKTNN